MTEDTSPDNLRKFLESDDPAMVMMGLSMAKASEVPDELLSTILKLYMWDEDKTVRAASKSVFTKYAPAEIKTKVKKWEKTYLRRKWLASISPYLFESLKAFDISERLDQLLSGLDDIGNENEKAIDPLIGIYRLNKWQEIINILQQILKKHNLDIGLLAEKGLWLCDCDGCDVWYDPNFWESTSEWEELCEGCCEHFDYKFGRGNY